MDHYRERRVIVNWDEECMWMPLMANRQFPEGDADMVERMLERIVEEHAIARVDTIVHCVFGTGFRSHIRDSKLTDLLSEFRPAALAAAGRDYFQIVLDLCRSRGIEFIAGFRMNDRHSLPAGSFVREHPEWKLESLNSNAMDYAAPEVRQHILDVVRETLDTYEVDGIEYDYMRWCHMFEVGRGSEFAHLLTDMHRKTRALLDEAGPGPGGQRLQFGVRVPQSIPENDFLGFDLKAWVQEGLVDYIVPADFFFTDFNMRTEDFVALTEGSDCRVYPQIAPCLCWGGNQREVNLSHYRAAVRNFYAFGAHGFSPYNYQVHWQRRRHVSREWARPVNWPVAMSYLSELRDPGAVAEGDRHYLFFPLWDRPSETHAVYDERIRLPRDQAEPQGTQRFRASEDFADPRLRVMFQLKAEGIRGTEDIEILLNGRQVERAYVNRTPVPEGQPEGAGYPLAAFDEYTVDLVWEPLGRILADGDNELAVRLLKDDGAADGEVVINEPELYVHVRR